MCLERNRPRYKLPDVRVRRHLPKQQLHAPLEARRQRLGITGVSAATAGLSALLTSSAHAVALGNVFTGDVAFPVSSFSGNISWDPFSADSSSTYEAEFINGTFSCSGAHLTISAGCTFSGTLQFAASCGNASFFWPGETISADDFATTISTVCYSYEPTVTAGDSLYFGYRIELSDDYFAYGWAEFSEAAGEIVLARWGIDTGNGSISIPEAIPEPSAYAGIAGLFFAGVVAFSRWKKRRALAA